MSQLRLKQGAPDPLDVANFSLPDAKVVAEDEDSVRRTQTGWRGGPALGAQIIVLTCTETTDLPVYCTWETYGLPGMQIEWQYALKYAGQLGHVAFRHIQLQCMFESPSDQERFSAIWRRVIGKEPQFEDVAAK